MAYQIKKAAVLGSGVMGSSIAAHLANIGIPVLLLDIVPNKLTEQEEAKGLTLNDKSVRNKFATTALEKLLKQKPAPLSTKKNLSLIEAGNFEDDLEKLKEVDWIIEVVVENLEIKKSLYEKIDAVRKQGTIITSNTSGISIEAMAEGRSEDFQKHFLGTHFFNPPRYLKLLEVIPTKKTDADVLNFMLQFGENRLGKGVVVAKDTPNFIANRIGTYGLLVTLREMEKRGYSIGEVDSVTGTLIGRPKSATFRTLDVVGLDTFMHVAKNAYDKTEGEEQKVFEIPEFMKKMIDNGWLGAKTKQGFYLKEGKEILELDPETFEYSPAKKLKTPSIEMAKQQKGLANKVKTLVYAKDRTGEILWSILSPTLRYSANLIGEIADDIVAIDNAMKWGFGWQQGPFEVWDAIGLVKSVEKMKEEGATIPAFIQNMLDNGVESFYKEEDGDLYFYDGGGYKLVPVSEKVIDLKRYKKKHGVIKKNTGASLIDLGDGIALLEFHSQSNAIGPDIIQMINFAIDEVEKNYKGLVIGNQGKNFCVGANLGMILMEAQDDNIFELDFIIRTFQDAMMKIKYSRKPVVAAPFQMTLGGGAEVCLPAAHIQASMETYIGLVEVGVGLIPGGAGNVNLYSKHLKGLPNGVQIDYQYVANKVFETIAMAKVATSAEEARENNFLDFADGISVNPDHQIYDAKQAALALYEGGYTPPKKEKIPVTGDSGYATMLLGADGMYLSGYISDHDLKIAKKLAYVLSGGKVPYGTLVDEQYMLDLEREAFLSLIQEPKSQQRMQHMLLKGKPLRN
ncbi:3-hydroxyacyl-CoA dehydrogenase/enoyl-CoA hydratase family protein [Sporosarcina highlanderae]|uniref:3-hydroxyacyl-CoA dehydrogenase NAD-binding domain-containing protein n=1 Tax=Sporosarcina highlanderae TaxID=3035916 RepID=A0ABT8JUG8_9BACL|nr:3-hydroxyacyl-CoA dehydrogenase/enoyl-CoA hydratase family protein [Sporosarcina highlanderae]MDN4608808.1 3-hydroxyacyl-CoA dehydrogenase NAD-binding domain-containing protein [Sporosarcina highlanderae]